MFYTLIKRIKRTEKKNKLNEKPTVYIYILSQIYVFTYVLRCHE